VPRERELHALAREAGRANELVVRDLDPSCRLEEGQDVADARLERPHASISSSAIEHPRGGAPDARPGSSKPPFTRRTRSAARTPRALSTFMRSQMRAMPTSPSATGASVTGSTGTTRAQGGSTKTHGAAPSDWTVAS